MWSRCHHFLKIIYMVNLICMFDFGPFSEIPTYQWQYAIAFGLTFSEILFCTKNKSYYDTYSLSSPLPLQVVSSKCKVNMFVFWYMIMTEIAIFLQLELGLCHNFI